MTLPKHKYLLTYRYAEIIHDLTVVFCRRYLSDLRNLSNLGQRRTIDQMVQAARSGKQNIVEGVSEGVTSKKLEIKLLGVARASIEELQADYEDYLRQNGLVIFDKNSSQVAAFKKTAYRLSNLRNLSDLGNLIEKPQLPGNPTNDANYLLTLCHLLSYLLSQQIKSAENQFVTKGGYSENLFLKRLKVLKSVKGFTILELTVVIGLIALLSLVALVILNPMKQIQKAWDSQRKNDLSVLKKVLEDYYNDKSHYPKAENICYSGILTEEDGVCTCFICGRAANTPNFAPYLKTLVCDPQYPQYEYVYKYDCDNQSWYDLYAFLSETSTGSYNYCFSSGSKNNCAPYPTLSAGQMPVTPTATPVITPTGTTTTYCPADPTNKHCNKNGLCNTCGTFEQCQAAGACNPSQLYEDVDAYGNCTTPCQLPY